jgi:hypothetical protein
MINDSSAALRFYDKKECRRAVSKNGRGGEIRTLGLYNPNVALYQAKLRPDDPFFPAQSRRTGEANAASVRLQTKSSRLGEHRLT